MLRRLKHAARFLSRPVLTPVATVATGLRLKSHLGKTFACLAGHDFIAACCDLVQAGCAAVKGQTDGIENGCLARAGWPGDGKNAVKGERRVCQVYLPFANQ